GKVRAAYFFGKPVAKGKVELEVQAEGEVLKRFDLKTDEDGRTSFTWTLPEAHLAPIEEQVGPLFASSPSGLLSTLSVVPFETFKTPRVWLTQREGDTALQFHCTITDSAAQKQSQTVTRTFTTSPLRIEVIHESGRVNSPRYYHRFTGGVLFNASRQREL